MIRRLGAAIAALILLAGMPTGALAAPTPSGALYITTLPALADVWIDGSYVGQSPVLLDALALGRHTVTVTKTGWTSQDVDVTVGNGNVALSSVALVHGPQGYPRSTGFLAVRGTTGAIFIDGSPKTADKRGQIPLAAGPHTLLVHSAHGNFTRSVSVYPDMRTDVLVRAAVAADESQTSVVAPAEDYLADGEYKIVGTRVLVKHAGHTVVGHVGENAYKVDGRDATYGSAPTLLGAKLYLPLALLEKIAGTKDR